MPVIFICEYCGEKDYHPIYDSYEGWTTHMMTFFYRGLKDKYIAAVLCTRHFEQYKKLKNIALRQDEGTSKYWGME